MPLRLYSPETFQPEDVIHAPILYPWRGVPGFEQEQNLPGHRDRYDTYLAEAREHYVLVNTPGEADVILFPANLNFCHHATAQDCFHRFLDIVAQSDRPGWVFAEGDLPERFQHPRVHLFHLSIYPDLNGPRGHARPPFLADSAREIELRPLPKASTPRVSFRGVAPPWHTSGRKFLPESIRYALFRLGVLPPLKWGYAPRAQATHALRDAPGLHYAETLLGQTPVNWSCGFFQSAPAHQDSFQRVRNDYLESILDSHYVLCARGQGNYSLRFYETLALGRIPVYIDTAPLPFEEHLDWPRHIVRVPVNAISRIGALVADHWQQNRPHFDDLATANRQLYEDWLTPTGYFRKLSLYTS